MFIIGLCGQSGSGKSSVCEILTEFGVKVLDCDKIYHELIHSPSECQKAISLEFGNDLVENGVLNRAKLRNIVFSNEEKRRKLNEISHFYVIKRLEDLIKLFENNGEKMCIIDAPLLFEAKLNERCNVVCAVVSDFSEQIRRICNRDGIDPEAAKERLSKQISVEELTERSDFIIQNTSDYASLKIECENLLKYCKTKLGEE